MGASNGSMTSMGHRHAQRHSCKTLEGTGLVQGRGNSAGGQRGGGIQSGDILGIREQEQTQ